MHQNLLSKNNDAQSTTKYGFLLWPNAQIVARALRLRRPLKISHMPWIINIRRANNCYKHLRVNPLHTARQRRVSQPMGMKMIGCVKCQEFMPSAMR